jgi:urate oxidase
VRPLSRLLRQSYGKERVRFLRVARLPGHHRIMDVTAGISLEGDFAEAYLTDSNGPVVATDTMKNTLTVLAHDDPADFLENYALRVAEYFLSKFAQVEKVRLRLEEKIWDRAEFEGVPHEHMFTGALARNTIRLEATREATALFGGLQHWDLLKTTGSGFAGFPRDEFTTLPETTDRILATRAELEWQYLPPWPHDYAAVRKKIQEISLRVFAGEYSPSVQRTLFRMGEEVLAGVPEIGQLRLAMPNKHYLPLNLSAFGRPAKQDILFLPTDEPHGQIEAVVGRT